MQVPAATQQVIALLDAQAPRTGKQLLEATGLPRRTVYSALKRLHRDGRLVAKRSLRDARQTYYWLAP